MNRPEPASRSRSTGLVIESGSNESNNDLSQLEKLCNLYAEKLALLILMEVFGINQKEKVHQNKRTIKSASIWKSVSVNWLDLPQEIWLTIFSYLTQAELYFVAQYVCKSFNQWSRDVLLWKSVDFHKMHSDMVHMKKLGLASVPSNISISHLCHVLTVFCEHITSIKISRYGSDCGLNETTLSKLCKCSSITKLDLGFCSEIGMTTIVKNCSKIVELNVEGSSDLRDADFADIHYLTHLRKICVSHCDWLTDQFLIHLSNLPNLRELISDGVMHLSERGLIRFMCEQPLMEVLILDGEGMMDDLVCFAAANLRNLRAFELSFSQSITNRSILSFKDKFSIERLKFRKCPEITSSSLCKVFSEGSIFSLKHFTVTECEGVTDEVLKCLVQSCPYLQFIMVDWCWEITDQGLCEIVNNCRNLRRLSLVGLYGINGDGWLKNLDKCLPHLKFLDASDCNHMPDEDLLDLVLRKPTMEVYTYYHDRVLVATPTCDDSETSEEEQENEKKEWTCPGERGVEVVF